MTGDLTAPNKSTGLKIIGTYKDNQNICFATGCEISKDVDNSGVEVCGGTVVKSGDDQTYNGAHLVLYGKNHASGLWNLVASNVSNESRLISDIYGYLSLVKDNNQGFKMSADCNPVICPYNSNLSFVRIDGDYSHDGAHLILYDSHTNGGDFALLAKNSTGSCSLNGFPNGTLLWGGSSVVTENSGTSLSSLSSRALVGEQASTYIDYQPINTVRNHEGSEAHAQANTPDVGTYAVGTSLFVGLSNGRESSSWTRGFWLYGHWNKSGVWYGYRSSESTSAITWNRLESVISSSSNYVRYDSGLQLCWGLNTVNASTSFTYPAAFNTNPMVVVTPAASDTPNRCLNVTSDSTTTFTARLSYNTSNGFTVGGDVKIYWLAIGTWK